MTITDIILDKINEDKNNLLGLKNKCIALADSEVDDCQSYVYSRVIDIVKEVANKYNIDWVPVSERMPTKEDCIHQKSNTFDTIVKCDESGYLTLTSSMLSNDYKTWINIPDGREVISWRIHTRYPYNPDCK